MAATVMAGSLISALTERISVVPSQLTYEWVPSIMTHPVSIYYIKPVLYAREVSTLTRDCLDTQYITKKLPKTSWTYNYTVYCDKSCTSRGQYFSPTSPFLSGVVAAGFPTMPYKTKIKSLKLLYLVLGLSQVLTFVWLFNGVHTFHRPFIQDNRCIS